MTSHVDRIYAAFQIDFQCSQVRWWGAVQTLILCEDIGAFDDSRVREHEVYSVVAGSEGVLECSCDLLVVEQISSVVGCI